MRAVKSLPMLPAEPACPAAAPVAGVDRSSQGVVCRVMQRDHEDDPGLGMSAAATGFIHNEADGGVLLTVKSDPSTVTLFCHGDALPVLTDEEQPGGRAHHSFCPVWQAEKERIADGRHNLLDEPEPEPVAAGVSTVDYSDPWAALRAGLDELSPSQAA